MFDGLCGTDATAALDCNHDDPTAELIADAKEDGLVEIGTTTSIKGKGCTFSTSTTTPISGTDVAKRTRGTDCWTVLTDGGKDWVWDLSQYAHRHGGKSGPIIAICGTNGTQDFLNKHKRGYLAQMEAKGGVVLGLLSSNIPTGSSGTVTIPSTVITNATLASHNTATSCWTDLYGVVWRLVPVQCVVKHPLARSRCQAGMCLRGRDTGVSK